MRLTGNGKATSEHVGRVLSLITERDLEGLRPALALLTDKERRALRRRVPGAAPAGRRPAAAPGAG
jgi:hypothetical protein